MHMHCPAGGNFFEPGYPVGKRFLNLGYKVSHVIRGVAGTAAVIHAGAHALQVGQYGDLHAGRCFRAGWLLRRRDRHLAVQWPHSTAQAPRPQV